MAGLRRPIRYQKGAEQGGHVTAGGVVLAQEAWQGSGRHGPQQTPWALMAGIAGACENLGGAFAGLEILRLHRDPRETADQKRHRRYTERSAQHSYSPDAVIRFPRPSGGGGPR